MSKPKKNLGIPSNLLIAGKRWKVRPFTKEEVKKAKQGVYINLGNCDFPSKTLSYLPGQHPEELLDTLLHEGLHAILGERSYFPPLDKLAVDEQLIPLLVSDLSGFLKQVLLDWGAKED